MKSNNKKKITIQLISCYANNHIYFSICSFLHLRMFIERYLNILTKKIYILLHHFSTTTVNI